MKKVLWIVVFLLGACLLGCRHTQSKTRLIVEARKPAEQYSDVLTLPTPAAPELAARMEVEILTIR